MPKLALINIATLFPVYDGIIHKETVKKEDYEEYINGITRALEKKKIIEANNLGAREIEFTILVRVKR